MKTILGSAIVVASCVAVPFAQEQRAPAPPAAPAHNVFVLTGCLMAGATEPSATFKLTDAMFVGQPPPGRAGEAGAVGTSGQKATYELRPVSGVNAQGLDADALKAHAGHRVEAVVRPIESPPPSRPTTTSGAVESAKPIEPAPERYTVTEIKRATGRCS